MTYTNDTTGYTVAITGYDGSYTFRLDDTDYHAATLDDVITQVLDMTGLQVLDMTAKSDTSWIMKTEAGATTPQAASHLPVKAVTYDRITKDFCVTVDGECIGYAASFIAGEAMADEHVYELLERGLIGRDCDLTMEEISGLGALAGEVIA